MRKRYHDIEDEARLKSGRIIQLSLLVLVVLLLVMGAAFGRHISAQAVDDRVTLSGMETPRLQQARYVTTTPLEQRLNISLALNPRDPAGLDALARAIYDPTSPYYHHYITPAEFKRRFAPTEWQVSQVTNYLREQGMQVTSIGANNLLLEVSGTVEQAQQSFGVQIGTYQLNARTFYANAQAPRLPRSLSGLVSAIQGLDNSVQLRSDASFERIVPRAASGLAPAQVSSAYNITPLYGANVHGEGQTVAWVELDGYNARDVWNYVQQYDLADGITVTQGGRTSTYGSGERMLTLNNVLVNGYNGSAGSGAIEVEGDIELMVAIAPGARQMIYEAPNSLQGFNAAFNRIVSDNRAKFVGVSWGLCEPTMGKKEIQTLDTILKQGAVQGITFFAASGDAGAYDCHDNNLAVSFPASDPYVLSVGGTSLQLDGDVYSSEMAWSNPRTKVPGIKGAGGGGGISSYFTQPAWQQGPGASNVYSSGEPCRARGGAICRQVPDVALNANPANGYAVMCSVQAAGCLGNGWLRIGGTSMAVPIWMGSMVLVSQYVQEQGQELPGPLAPILYMLASQQQPLSPFRDITEGDNLYYPATEGYDLASGLGSPDVFAIAQDLLTGEDQT